MRKLLAILVLLVVTPAAADTFDDTSKTVHESVLDGGWTIRINAKGGVPNFCQVSSRYGPGEDTNKFEITLGALVDADTYVFIIQGREWKTTKDREYAVRFQFDNSQVIEAKAFGAFGNGVMAMFHPKSPFASKFMHSAKFSIKINRKRIGNFPLSGSYDALAQLKLCHSKLGGFVTSSNGDTF